MTTSQLHQLTRAGFASLLLALAIGLPGPALASDGQIQTLDDALERIMTERRSISEANREREARFIAQRDRQRQRLEEVRSEVEAAEQEASQLESQRNDNERALSELREQLADREGEFGELFGVARAAAADLNEQLRVSLVSAQYRGRGGPLREMAQAEALPTVDQLEHLWFTFMQEATEQGKVVRFTTPVVGVDNKPSDHGVTRIGPFTASSGGNFLALENGALRFLPRQPGGGSNRTARRLEGHNGGDVVAGIIDPSLGELLGMVVETPTLRERIDQGGGIGYTIIVVSALGMLLGLYKWIALSLTARSVRRQMRSDDVQDNNPLGRVIQAYAQHRRADIETVQLKLEDAVLKEVPKLERGLSLVKVLAAVAPLGGLLGTVIGMIVTFQAITLYGTGDPQLMAGGISQALVTTVLGLIAAIPLLLLYTFASGKSREIAQVLEEQSAGLIAERAERGI